MMFLLTVRMMFLIRAPKARHLLAQCRKAWVSSRRFEPVGRHSFEYGGWIVINARLFQQQQKFLLKVALPMMFRLIANVPHHRIYLRHAYCKRPITFLPA